MPMRMTLVMRAHTTVSRTRSRLNIAFLQPVADAAHRLDEDAAADERSLRRRKWI